MTLKAHSTVAVWDDAMAWTPTSICRSGLLAPPSVTSTGCDRTVIRPVMSAETRNVPALMAKTRAGEPRSSSRPPMAGPAMIAMLSTVLRMVFAAASSRSGTVCGVRAAVAGS